MATTKGFVITGRAAHERIARLFIKLTQESQSHPNDNEAAWTDLSPTSHNTNCAATTSTAVEFLWENSPRHETKSIRDSVRVYSHLPNGTNVLDDKWVLARLLGGGLFVQNDADDFTEGNVYGLKGERKDVDAIEDALATLESHCFRGADFVTFANRVGLLSNKGDLGSAVEQVNGQDYKFDDLVTHENCNRDQLKSVPPPAPGNLWVIKDAMSNGAGGIWILDSRNIEEFLDQESSLELPNNNATSTERSSVLHPTHRYIAQRYAWPPTLYAGRKCHVRVYGCITAQGEAFVHKRAFLHVANDTFGYCNAKDNNEGTKFKSSVHITNCCANSHDAGKFAGEICANLLETQSNNDDVALGRYFPSIAASLAELAKRSAPFLRGGRANNGFEYLGMDFVLSSVTDPKSFERSPVAYLLEVNAPPSQDTATGLPHAEDLHDEVLSDLLKMCVLPELNIAEREFGGWQLVYNPLQNDVSDDTDTKVPSKAAFVNQVRWNLFEKKAAKEYELYWSKVSEQSSECESPSDFRFDHNAFVKHVRSQFPYFSSSRDVFLESGGGSQVPKTVIDATISSMMHRDRSVNGAECLREARESMLSLLAGQDNLQTNMIFMGPNATSLLKSLARKCFRGVLKEGDEIVLATENHLANVLPWTSLAIECGARVKWWTTTDAKIGSPTKRASNAIESSVLSELVTSRTKILAISHASNILGCVRDISSICRLVRSKTSNEGQVIVDGVAAAPHMLSRGVFLGDEPMQPDWYVVSLHKMFGPHVGCLIGKRILVQKLLNPPHKSDGAVYKMLELGTMNYEACAGASALREYFWNMNIGNNSATAKDVRTEDNLKRAVLAIQIVEARLVDHLVQRLSQSSPLVRIIEDQGHQRIGCGNEMNDRERHWRLPFISFIHSNIKAKQIVKHCRSNGIICRACKFLSTDRFWKEMGISEEGVVRFSLAHYNTTEEIDRTIDVLEMMGDWV